MTPLTGGQTLQQRPQLPLVPRKSESSESGFLLRYNSVSHLLIPMMSLAEAPLASRSASHKTLLIRVTHLTETPPLILGEGLVVSPGLAVTVSLGVDGAVALVALLQQSGALSTPTDDGDDDGRQQDHPGADAQDGEDGGRRHAAGGPDHPL